MTDEWVNVSFSSTGEAEYIPWFSSMPNGLVAYGSVCFIGVVVFTARLVAYYARPKLPPIVGALTFLAWSGEKAVGKQKTEKDEEDGGNRDATRGQASFALLTRL